MKPQKSTFKAYAQQNNFLPIKHYAGGGKSGRFLGGLPILQRYRVASFGDILNEHHVVETSPKRRASNKSKGLNVKLLLTPAPIRIYEELSDRRQVLCTQNYH